MAREFIEKQDSLNQGREKLNRSIDRSYDADTKSDKAIKDSGEALTTSQSVRDELNQVVIDGDSSVEAAQARVGADGTNYSVLKERLDSEHGKVKEQLAQIAVNVKNFGAKGDGVTDDTIAIKSAINTLQTGDKLLFPNGDYLTTDTIQITKPITLDMQGHILAKHDKVGLLVKDNSERGSFHPNYHNRHKLNLRVNVKRVNGYQLNQTAIGVEFVNVFGGKIYLEELDNNYIGAKYTGLVYGTGYGAVSYVETKVGMLRSIKTNILLSSEGTGSWVTQNQFYGGSLTYETSFTEEQISVVITNSGNNIVNENTFFGVSFEGAEVAIKGVGILFNKFISCRFEMPNLVKLFDFDAQSIANEITHSSYVSEHMAGSKFTDLAGQTTVVYTDYKLGRITYFDGIFYITPTRNRIGRSQGFINHPHLRDLPTNWKVKIVSDGMSRVTYYSDQTTVGSNMLVPINRGDEINLYERSEKPYDTVTLTTPPDSSIEFLLVHESSAKLRTLSIDESVGSLIDKSGENKTVPLGTRFTKLYYEYSRNVVYILSHF